MAWTASGMFTATMSDYFSGTIANTGAGAADLDAAAALKVALYDNSITPNYEAASAATQYGAGGIWVATGSQTGTTQVYHTGQWAQAGVTLAAPALTRPGAGVVMFDANDAASGAAATMSNIYGALVYIDALTTPVIDQGLFAVYFGGTGYSVTSGTFTIQWNGSGLFRLTIA